MVDITGMLAGHSALAMLAGPLDTATNFVFFQTINDFLRTEIDIMQWKLLSSSATIIGFVAVSVLTVWIMFQGFRIVTGQSRQPMMVLVGDSLKATLVVFIATTAAYSSSSVYWTLSDGMSTTIAQYVTGESGSPFQHIDNNLAGMEVAMGTIDAIDTGGDQAAQDAKDRDRWFTGIGIAGPSVIAGSMLLLNKIALALFVGFGPIFIMCLLFEPTKQLFSKWLLYGIGTVFSLAVLSVMVTIAMKMMAAVTASFAVKYLLSMPELGGAGSTDGINSMALQQGGLGLLLTTMIISAPPMAASFFQGTLGQFNSYSPFGHIKPEPPNSRGGYGVPGTPSYVPPVANQTSHRDTHQYGGQSNTFGSYTQLTGTGSSYASTPDRIKKDGEMT
ncbi:type IV secretion system protein VirB6 [Luteibacter sp. UNCMF366Tsu5.1]|nr:type IV secretion system protein VirB6 [Luteibacter sp. UNCMF366Tsu5.1]